VTVGIPFFSAAKTEPAATSLMQQWRRISQNDYAERFKVHSLNVEVGEHFLKLLTQKITCFLLKDFAKRWTFATQIPVQADTLLWHGQPLRVTKRYLNSFSVADMMTRNLAR
jgi:hypothetical protein